MHDVIDLVDDDGVLLGSSPERPRARKQPPPRSKATYESSSPTSSAGAGPSRLTERTFAIASQVPKKSRAAHVDTLSSSPPAKAPRASISRSAPIKKRSAAALDDSSDPDSDEEEIRKFGKKLGRGTTTGKASASSKKAKGKSKDPDEDGISQKELDKAARELEKRTKAVGLFYLVGSSGTDKVVGSRLTRRATLKKRSCGKRQTSCALQRLKRQQTS